MTQWNIQPVVHDLQQVRYEWRALQFRQKKIGERELPSKQVLQYVLDSLCGILFPMRLGPTGINQQSENGYIGYTLNRVLDQLKLQVQLTLSYDYKRHQRSFSNQSMQDNVDTGSNLSKVNKQAHAIVQKFADQLASIRRLIDADICAAFEGDPAAHSVDEVLLCYPGILAMIYHRLAHQLFPDVPILARIISELAHSATGIDIHPGAQIGPGFFIDHGTGVVIGETCIIGERVRIYQAVTLGAKRFELTADGQLKKNYARHPIVEDDVVIYAGATILGCITIGKGSIIGGNVWLTQNVAPGSHVLQSALETFLQPKIQAELSKST
ncbi:serine O-acetyltransferase EpsC [Acinetobacter rudis]|nr:serine O-acetyltransferase EpsC [Acinetobacter rudis]MDQ8954541.1 serine O-acetyltransferase EpsC [Acinetobacter rudis]